MYISKDTISTIKCDEKTGKATLKFYQNKETVFSKNYKNFTCARIAQTKLMRKFYYESKD